MEQWLVNGKPGGRIDPDDRGFGYGDGLFETIAIRGGAARFIERHLSRLNDGCRQLGIPLPPTSLIREEAEQLVAGRQHGTIKVIVTRGPGPRGYCPPAAMHPTRAMVFLPENADAARRPAGGVRVVKCKTPASCNPALAGVKTLNRLDNVLARAELQTSDADEGLMSDLAGGIIGGTMSNLFMVHRGRILTPTLRNCGIRGVMRGLVLEAAAAAGEPVLETEIGMQQLAGAEELFLTNSLIGLWPVRWLAGRTLDTGPVTRRIARALRALGVEECAA